MSFVILCCHIVSVCRVVCTNLFRKIDVPDIYENSDAIRRYVVQRNNKIIFVEASRRKASITNYIVRWCRYLRLHELVATTRTPHNIKIVIKIGNQFTRIAESINGERWFFLVIRVAGVAIGRWIWSNHPIHETTRIHPMATNRAGWQRNISGAQNRGDCILAHSGQWQAHARTLLRGRIAQSGKRNLVLCKLRCVSRTAGRQCPRDSKRQNAAILSLSRNSCDAQCTFTWDMHDDEASQLECPLSSTVDVHMSFA